MKEHIKEVIVVEGKNDTNVLQSYFDCDTIETSGDSTNPLVLERIKEAQRVRGVIVFTDPDRPGEHIRRWIQDNVPGIKHAFIAKEASSKKKDYLQYRIGKLYAFGYGVEQDYGKAIEYLSRASHTRKTALVNLGDCYKETGAYDRAFDCYEKAYEQGQKYAACRIAIMYEKGLGVVVDNDEAMKWYTLGAEAGDRYAQYLLGRRYLMGDIVPADTLRAIEWLSRSGNNGYAPAWCQLGVSYTTGKYLPRNYQKAFAYYYRAAQMRDDYSALALGECYRKGRGCEQNDTLAYQWFCRAAEYDDEFAQKKLGDCYFYGWGVEKNLDEAIKYYRMASDKGVTSARKMLKKIEKKKR